MYLSIVIFIMQKKVNQGWNMKKMIFTVALLSLPLIIMAQPNDLAHSELGFSANTSDIYYYSNSFDNAVVGAIHPRAMPLLFCKKAMAIRLLPNKMGTAIGRILRNLTMIIMRLLISEGMATRPILCKAAVKIPPWLPSLEIAVLHLLNKKILAIPPLFSSEVAGAWRKLAKVVRPVSRCRTKFVRNGDQSHTALITLSQMKIIQL